MARLFVDHTLCARLGRQRTGRTRSSSSRRRRSSARCLRRTALAALHGACCGVQCSAARCMSHVARCMSHVARCMSHGATQRCTVQRIAARCMSHVARCMSHAARCTSHGVARCSTPTSRRSTRRWSTSRSSAKVNAHNMQPTRAAQHATHAGCRTCRSDRARQVDGRFRIGRVIPRAALQPRSRRAAGPVFRDHWHGPPCTIRGGGRPAGQRLGPSCMNTV